MDTDTRKVRINISLIGEDAQPLTESAETATLLIGSLSNENYSPNQVGMNVDRTSSRTVIRMDVPRRFVESVIGGVMALVMTRGLFIDEICISSIRENQPF